MMRSGIFKTVFASFAVTALVVALPSCKEVNPLVTNNPTDTTVTLQQKHILIEDVTGVHCPNCPQAHEIAQQLQTENPGRVEVVAVHDGSLAYPYPGEPDFRTTTSATVNNFLGPADYWPKGAIDRLVYNSQNEILMDRTLWSGIAAQRLTDSLKVEVNLSKSYNAATHKLDLNVSLHYLADVTDAQKITVYLTESGLVYSQEFPDSVSTAYAHNNVLRAAITDPVGDPITEATPTGTTLQRAYAYTLPDGWTPQNCRAVVFVSRNTADPIVGKEVLQVSGINVD